MKVRIQTLIEELDISSQTLINWLTRRGYPGARPQDWLTPRLVELARLELGSRALQSVGTPLRAEWRGQSRHARFQSGVADQEMRGDETRHESRFSSSLMLSADLQPTPESASESASEMGLLPPLNDPSIQSWSEIDQLDNSERSLTERERARSDLLLKRLEGQRAHYEEREQELRRRYEQTVAERTQLRQTLYATKQNQATLDQTCRELTQELEQTQREVNELRRDLTAQEKMSNAIDQVTQQKKAWRAKALALEERVQTNQQVTNQLRELGMDSLELQVKLFQTLLSTPESASQLFHAIKMVEYDDVKKMVERWVVKTCAHPLCNQVNRLRNCLSLRIDRPQNCQVCQGEQNTRWFQRMMASCERAHVRRFLLVGGEKLYEEIRRLTEGKNIDFRLISAEDQSSDQRIQSRLESCDLLISWSRGSLSSEVSRKYLSIAKEIDRPTIILNGDQARLDQLARYTLNWVTRTGGHSA